MVNSLMVELLRKIKRKHQKEIAFAQDIIVELIYNFFPNAILHGGTLIWRCFNGNRFSEDLDFYLTEKNEEKIKEFFKALEKRGFVIKKFRIKQRSVFSKLVYQRIEVRIEIVFKKVKAILLDYECIDGRIIPIKGLAAEDLLEEKIEAFLDRKKMRDLYDIYFLLKFVKKNKEIEQKIDKIIKNFKKPEDEQEIKKLILFGYCPSSKEIIEYLKRWIE